MAKGGGKSGKVRYDGIDVAAMVNQLQRELLGRRIINIYDGVSDADAFLLKLDGGRTMLFLESGIRFHTTQHQSSLQQEGMPSPFCSKLRKHLRGLRLERIVQLGKYDRVVNFVFGTGESRHSLILELYARGNIILTKASYEILALLRSHDYEEVSVKVGQIYPVTYATSLGNTFEGLLSKNAEEALAWARTELLQHQAKQLETGKKKNSSTVMPLKAFLLKPTSGVYHFGPSLLEHCILCADLDPNTKVGIDTIDVVLSMAEWAKLLEALKEEGARTLEKLTGSECSGYILYRSKERKSDEAAQANSNSQLKIDGLAHVDKVLEEFQPHLLKQHESRPVIKYDSFSKAVDDFFAHLGGQKQALRAEAAESAAHQKLEKIKKDQQHRVDSLLKEQDRLRDHAQLIEANAEDVDKALGVINSALDSGMDWEALEQLVDVEQQNENPIALLIQKLKLEEDAMTLLLPNTSQETDGKNPHVHVTVSLQESAYGNARDMYAKYRAFKEKSQKTLEASSKALKAAELTAQKQLAEAQKKSKLTTTIQAARKPHWFEKFHWFITSDNYLVLGGRDAHQNELLVKRYLRAGDAYLHADVHGASSCIIRAKRRRKKNGRTEPVPLSDQALQEAGNFTICRSSAWASKMVTSAWWVESHQVSKTAPTGEYLKVGSFMVRGKKNFLPPSQLEMGLAVLFRLGDEDSIARHKNERRDFALIDSFDDDYQSEDEHQIQNGAKPMSDVDAAAAEPMVEGEPNSPAEDANHEVVENIYAEEITPVTREETEREVEGIAESEKVDESGLLEKTPIRKGLSVRERKLIKKYGSLEAAQKAAAEREKAEQRSIEKSEMTSEASTIQSVGSSQQLAQPKRGKRGKMKKAARKYADQDDEDRELALMALHGGEKKSRNSRKDSGSVTSDVQGKAGAETQALLVTNAAEVASSLPEGVKGLLAECVTVVSGLEMEQVVRWDKFDGDVLAQLKSLASLDQQLAAAKRLLQLKQSTRVDNFSASLAGIIRTIKKFGDVTLDDETASEKGGKRKTKEDKLREKEVWKETLAAEGIPNEDGDEIEIDDTAEISKLTGMPHAEDALLYVVPVCAPYQTLSKYKYKVKLNPGNLKRGKAAKQCIEIFLKNDGDKSLQSERNRELIKRIADNDWVQVMCSDVKISAPGANRGNKKNKGNTKRGKRK